MKAASSKKQALTVLLVVVLAVVAAATLMTSTAQAALDKRSQDYEATVELTNLDVALTESNAGTDGPVVQEGETLLAGLIPEGEVLGFGKEYKEELAAYNCGESAEYMRVVIRKYWRDGENGDSAANKRTDLSPELIQLSDNWSELGWVVDTSASTQEQTVLYSKRPVASKDSLLFNQVLSISPDILSFAKGNAEKKAISPDEASTGGNLAYSYTAYKYDDCKFCIEVEVDSVQTHNAAQAIKSAWGVDAHALGIEVVD